MRGSMHEEKFMRAKINSAALNQNKEATAPTARLNQRAVP
jgi:hypothetical protein